MVCTRLIFPRISDFDEQARFRIEEYAMSRFPLTNQLLGAAPLAAANPARLAWAQGLLGLLLLFSVALVAVFLGWVLARWMRLRHARLTAVAFTGAGHADAWTEAARRLGADDDTVDLDPPPDQTPPHNPDTRWQA